MDATTAALWDRFVASLPEEQRPRGEADVWAFGDSPEMADELAALVIRGTKTATASLLAEYEVQGTAPRQLGSFSVVLDGRARPVCVIETTEVRIRAFDEVEAAFAADEGEGNRSLEYWRRVHWTFFARRCAELGIEPRADMLVVCERFRVRPAA